MNIQDRFPLGLTGLISLLSKGLSRVFSSTTVQKASILCCSAFFMVQLSNPNMTTGKTMALTRQTFVGKATSLLFNTLTRFVILVAQSCPTLCDPVDCSLPGSSVHEIFQARILEWVAISFSRRSSQPRDRTWVSHIAGRYFTF